VDTNTLLQQTIWKGTVAAAPTNAPPDIIAVLTPEPPLRPRQLPLRTDDAVLAARLRELAGRKHTPVILLGRLAPDGSALYAAELLPLPAEPKSDRNPRHAADPGAGAGW
jgi:hypothetical protein